MSFPRGRRRLTCYHEAGHCLARWFLGFHADFAEVLTVEQVRAGVMVEGRREQSIECEGAAVGYDIHFPMLPHESGLTVQADQDRYVSTGRVRAEMAMVELMAGMQAEAAYRKRTLFTASLGARTVDYDGAKKIAVDWLADPSEALDFASRRAGAIVRSRPGKVALAGMADRLWNYGRVDQADISTLCSAAYGGREPGYGAWLDCWPPTLAQLRDGFIPPVRQRAA